MGGKLLAQSTCIGISKRTTTDTASAASLWAAAADQLCELNVCFLRTCFQLLSTALTLLKKAKTSNERKKARCLNLKFKRPPAEVWWRSWSAAFNCSLFFWHVRGDKCDTQKKCEKDKISYVEKVNPRICANFGIKVVLVINMLLPHSEILPQLCWQNL